MGKADPQIDKSKNVNPSYFQVVGGIKVLLGSFQMSNMTELQ
jgi:hypothetical protein